MMELLNEIVNFVIDKFDVLFSGAGLFVITLIGSLSAFIYKKIKSRKMTAEHLKKVASPPETLESESKKNKLKIPAFTLTQTGMSFTGGNKPVKDHDFKVTNSGGKAFNVAVSGSILPQPIELKDINRHGSNSFTLAFGGNQRPQEISLEIKCLDEDGDPHSQVILLHLIGSDYIAA
ncbi:hypothetical protein Q8O96_28140 [Pseudomonas sp. LPH60]|uniref:hypothetical protein n=1 Tax=Pseudomonas sp. LPH60 TaxID=3065906 RepID=UPI00273BA6E4|nr:hypothetical protein [Pseudomonas sp. LPH60]MDP4572949.1 hypothetical protein [Pseudomonas sp. LPH60]